MINIKFKKIRKNARIPFRAYKNDAGYDCFISKFSSIDIVQINDFSKKDIVQIHDIDVFKKVLDPNERILCKLGFATEIPEGYYFQIVPRSGLALRNGITIVNSPATIDSGYRDEWGVILLNTGKKPYELSIGDKICQIICRKMVDINIVKVSKLNDSKRGKGKFGSSGK